MVNKKYASINRVSTKDEDISQKSLEILKDIFENINRWLNFAEAKNGALIGINGLFFFNTVDYLFKIINGELKGGILIVGGVAFIFFLSILISLISFFSNTSKEDSMPCVLDNNINDNILLFYEDISKYKSAELYLHDIYKYYLKVNFRIEDLKRIELDYAKEILINSKITSHKYRMFKYALRLNFIGILLFAIFLMIA